MLGQTSNALLRPPKEPTLSQQKKIEPGVLHESIQDDTATSTASPRAFGLTFAAVLFVIGVLPLFRHGPLRVWSLVVGLIFLVLAVTLPGLLGPLSRAWSAIGSLLHRVMTPVLMGLIFVVAVTPVALLRRVFGTSGLALRFDSKLDSYWIRRDHSVVDSESLKRQF